MSSWRQLWAPKGTQWADGAIGLGKALGVAMAFAVVVMSLALMGCGQSTGARVNTEQRSETSSEVKQSGADNPSKEQGRLGKPSEGQASDQRTKAQMSLAEIRGGARLPTTGVAAVDELGGEGLDLYESAQELMFQGQFEQAKEKLEAALKLEPNSYQIYQALSRVAIGQGRLSEALDYISTAGKIDPDHMEIYILEGRIAGSRSQPERAIQNYALALLCSDARDENIQTGQALLELSVLLVKEGYLRAGVETYERLSKVVSQTVDDVRPGGVLQRLARSPGRIWLSIGRLYGKLKEPVRAAEAYEKARQVSGKDFEVQALAARGLAQIGEFDKALDIVDELAEDYPTRTMAGSLLVWIRQKQGKKAEIEEDLKEMRRRYPRDSGVAIILASYYRQADQPDKARAVLIEVVEEDRRFLPAYRALSSLEVQEGQRGRAVKWLARMVRVRRSSIIEARVRVFKIAGQKEQARELLKELSRKQRVNNDFALAWAVATVAEKAEMPAAAQKYYGRAIELQPRFGQLYVYLIRAQLRQGRADQALAVINQAQQAKVVGVSFYQLEGLAFLLKDDLDSAISSLEAAVGAQADDQAARQVLAEALLAVGRPDEAVKHLEILTGSRPDDQSLHRQLIEAYLADGYPDRAVATAREFMKGHRLHTETALAAAEAFLAAKKAEQAVEVLEKLSVRRELLSYWQGLFAEALIGSDRVGQAREELSGWLEQSSSAMERASLSASMSAILFDSGQKELAGELALQELKTKPESPSLRELLIHVLLDRKDYAQADKLVVDWLAQKQDRATRRLRAMVLLDQKQYDQARRNLEELVDEEGQDIDSLHMLAQVYESSGQSEQVEELYQRILQAKPEDVWANNNLGFALADSNRRLDDAEGMVRKSLRGVRSEASVADSMGWVLYKRGRFGQALSYLSRSVRLMDEPMSELLEHLGDTYYRLEEVEQAVEAWDQALRSEQSREESEVVSLKRLQMKLDMIKSKQIPPVAWSVVDDLDGSDEAAGGQSSN